MKKDETLVIQSLNANLVTQRKQTWMGCHLMGARVQQTMNQLEQMQVVINYHALEMIHGSTNSNPSINVICAKSLKIL
jgi:hypothetical protein